MKAILAKQDALQVSVHIKIAIKITNYGRLDRDFSGLALLAVICGTVPSLPLHIRRSDTRAQRITPWSSHRMPVQLWTASINITGIPFHYF